MRQRKYAVVAWTAADVQTMAPRMTDEDAEEWLQANEKHLRNRLVELGWDVIGHLLQFDGVDTSDPENGHA